MVATWDSGRLVNIIMRFARNGQLVSREVSELPEVAVTNAAYGPDKTKGRPQAALDPSPGDNSLGSSH